MTDKTYVYNGKEVVLTGRTATKELRSGRNRTLYEIRPLTATPEQKDFNEWVEMEDLFEIGE